MNDGLNSGFAIPAGQWPWWAGLALLALVALSLLMAALERRRRNQLALFVESPLAPRLLVGHDGALRKPLFWLPLLGFAFMALAFAQPHWGERLQEVRHRSRDVLVLLDTSESMRAKNPLPNRLERAKQKIVSLLQRAPAARFGLIVFSGASQLVCPLTLDRGYFMSVLNAVDTDSIGLEGTDIAAALEESAALFRQQEEDDPNATLNSRAIFLISDGEQVSRSRLTDRLRDDALAAARAASRYARILVMGVGDPQGAQVAYTQTIGRQIAGISGAKPHLSRLDEEILERIAREGNGVYVRLGPDDSDVAAIHGLLESLSTRSESTDVRLTLANRFQWPLAAALLCFAGEGLWLVLLPHLRDRRARRDARRRGPAAVGAAAIVLTALTLCWPAQAGSFDRSLEEGFALLRSGNAEAALDAFRELRQPDAPNADLVNYSIGLAHYHHGLQESRVGPPRDNLERLELAKKVFEDLLASREPFVRKHAQYNLATSAAQIAKHHVAASQIEEAQEAFGESIRAYEAVLRMQPGNETAAQNLGHIRYSLKRLLQRPPAETEKRLPGDEDDGEEQGSGESNDEEGEEAGDQGEEESQRDGDSEQAEEPMEAPSDRGEAAALTMEVEEQAQTLSRENIEALLQTLEDRDREEQKHLRRAKRLQRRPGDLWW